MFDFDLNPTVHTVKLKKTNLSLWNQCLSKMNQIKLIILWTMVIKTMIIIIIKNNTIMKADTLFHQVIKVISHSKYVKKKNK